MSKNIPWIPITVIVVLLGSVMYMSQTDKQPYVGKIEDLQQREMDRAKAEMEAAMKKQTPNDANGLGTSRTAPSSSEVKGAIENIVDKKRKKLAKSPYALIMNPYQKTTSQTVNTAEPFNSWFREEGGRKDQ